MGDDEQILILLFHAIFIVEDRRWSVANCILGIELNRFGVNCGSGPRASGDFSVFSCFKGFCFEIIDIVGIDTVCWQFDDVIYTKVLETVQ